jgi:glucose-6-phosphate isomerase
MIDPAIVTMRRMMTTQQKLNLDISLLNQVVRRETLLALQPRLDAVHSSILNKTCAGNNFLGWVNLPWDIEAQLPRIKETAAEIRNNADHLLCIGIGGSYLGARAAIDFLADPFEGNSTVVFAGHQISADYNASLLDHLLQKQVCINVISKSGTTTEPAVAFRIVTQALAQKYSKDELRKRIIATTDRSRGVLRGITDREGYRSFIIEDDIGGRFSVFSPVGLLPIAAAGYDIEALTAGARDMAKLCKESTDIFENPALTYAAARYLLYSQGKTVEILSSFEPSLAFIGEWWKQLFGESEGKEGKGIYPTSANLTTDLHSLGQYMQEGTRMLFETFLILAKPGRHLEIPHVEGDSDGLNFIAGKTLDDVNHQAYLGTQYAHYDGSLPNMTLTLPERNEYNLGQLLYFFEFAVAVSGLLLGINPFNQPGVEAYKNNMYALLGKPGFEAQKKTLLAKIKGE